MGWPRLGGASLGLGGWGLPGLRGADMGDGRFGLKQAAGTPGLGLYHTDQRPQQSGGTNHIGRKWPQVGDLETTLDAAWLAGWLAWLAWLAGLAWLACHIIMV